MALRGKKILGLSSTWSAYFETNGGLVKVARGLKVAPATLRKYARGERVKPHVSTRLSGVEGLPSSVVVGVDLSSGTDVTVVTEVAV